MHFEKNVVVVPQTAPLPKVSVPEKCTLEQIAGLIYINVTYNFSDGADLN
jgi:hypothetical protein